MSNATPAEANRNVITPEATAKYTNDLALWLTDHEVTFTRVNDHIHITNYTWDTLVAAASTFNNVFQALCLNVNVSIDQYVPGKDAPTAVSLKQGRCTSVNFNICSRYPEVLTPPLSWLYGSPEWDDYVASLSQLSVDPLGFVMAGLSVNARRMRALVLNTYETFSTDFVAKARKQYTRTPFDVNLSNQEQVRWVLANVDIVTTVGLSEAIHSLEVCFHVFMERVAPYMGVEYVHALQNALA